MRMGSPARARTRARARLRHERIAQLPPASKRAFRSSPRGYRSRFSLGAIDHGFDPARLRTASAPTVPGHVHEVAKALALRAKSLAPQEAVGRRIVRVDE